MNERTRLSAPQAVISRAEPSIGGGAAAAGGEVLRQKIAELDAGLQAAQLQCRQYEQQLATAKTAQEQSESRANRLQDLLDSLPQAIFETREDGLISYVNRAAYAMFGYEPAEVARGINPVQLLVPADQARAVERARALLNGEPGPPSEYLAVRKNGERFPVLIHSNPIFWGGRVIGARGVLVDVTERKQTQMALAKSEVLWRAVFQGAPYPIAIWRLSDGAYLEVNPAFEAYFGFGMAEISGKTSPIVTSHEAAIRRVLERLRREGSVQNEEVTVDAKDGKPLAMLYSAATFSVGEEPYCVAVVVDITERRRTEQALRENEAVTASLFAATPAGIALLADRVFQKVNAALCRITGYEEAELIGKSTRMVYSDDEEFLRVGRELYGQGGIEPPWTLEARVRRRDGLNIEVLLGASPFRPTGWRGVVVTVLDITDRKQAEEELVRAKALLLAAVQHTPVGMIIADAPEARVRLVNSAALAICGGSQDFLTGAPVRSQSECWESSWPDGRLVTNEDSPLRRAACMGETVTNLEMRIRRADGETRWVLANAAPVRDLQGKVIAGVAVFPDITELKQAEAAKAKLEEQMRQSQKLEAIGVLAGGIAHDFNNILGAMISYAELARRASPEKAEVQDYLENVLKACARAKDLVRQILSFSRQQKQERKPIALQLVVKEALKLLRSSLPASVEIVERLASQLPQVLADPTQIHQVLVNLCANAAHAMRHRQGRLEITLEPFEVQEAFAVSHPDLRPGRYVRLEVSDNGEGMDEATLQHIFEPFFTTKGPGEGTGLGLSVVHGIVKEHDGAIYVRSQLCQGTVFELFLPALQLEEEPTPAPRTQLVRGQQERILVVDDEAALCSAMSRMLRYLGYQPTAISDPRRALAEFCEHPQQFDLVITDLTMPGLGGVDLAAALQAVRPGLPVLLTSGFSGTFTQEKARGLGLQGIIQKPIELAQLSIAVHQALAPSSASPKDQPTP